MTRMRHLGLLLATFVIASTEARAQRPIQTLDWGAIHAAGTLKSGTVVTQGTESTLRLVSTGPAQTLPLAVIERPAITTARYAVRGRVRYENAAAGSYLEMWSHLGEGAFFSRTLGEAGPMAQLAGASDWRPFLLPFTNREGGAPPQRLVLNLVMAGAGSVEIGPLELVQFAPGEDVIAADTGAWWSDRTAGLVGASLGTTCGILGALVGWLAAAGRAKPFVVGVLRAFAILGLAAFVTGVVAAVVGQPYGVFFPLLLVGGITAPLGFALAPTVLRHYETIELRRMQALDA